MKVENILVAEKEAVKFLAKINAVKYSGVNGHLFRKRLKLCNMITNRSKQTGDLRRASMDLTRALSKLRQETW